MKKEMKDHTAPQQETDKEKQNRQATFTRRALLSAGLALPFLYSAQKPETAFAQSMHTDHTDVHSDHSGVGHADHIDVVNLHGDHNDRGHNDRGHNDRGHNDRGHNDQGHNDQGHNDRGRGDVVSGTR